MKFTNPLKPHIVQFKDGSYGIRKLDFLFLEYTYLDLCPSPSGWLTRASAFFNDCRTDRLDAVYYAFNKLEEKESKRKRDNALRKKLMKDKGEPI